MNIDNNIILKDKTRLCQYLRKEVSDDDFQKFYKKYEKEILSYENNNLALFYEKTGIRILHEVKIRNSKRISKHFCTSCYGHEYIDYLNEDNNHILYNINFLQNKSKNIDILITTYCDDLGKDKGGIYMINDNIKEYIYSFKGRLIKNG